MFIHLENYQVVVKLNSGEIKTHRFVAENDSLAYSSAAEVLPAFYDLQDIRFLCLFNEKGNLVYTTDKRAAKHLYKLRCKTSKEDIIRWYLADEDIDAALTALEMVIDSIGLDIVLDYWVTDVNNVEIPSDVGM